MLQFAKNNQTKYDEIVEAIASGDIRLAHRLAHTLKGNAGLIGEDGLRNATVEVETLLKGNLLPIPDAAMHALQAELAAVLGGLQALLDEQGKAAAPLDDEEIGRLYDRLAPMLERINPECVNLIDGLRAVPGAEELVAQIEDYDFESAAATLAELRKARV